jgi:hypothetical protein
VGIDKMRGLRDLHDATLTRIQLDWVAGDFAASFIVGADQPEIQIIGKGIKSFTYTRDFPWGRSVSVNKCQIETGDVGVETILTIEMQSGDELVAKGEHFELSL